jgi:signal transduction histidine kinase
MLLRLNKISIKWRLFIYLSMFAAVMLILLWLFQVVFLQSFYRSIKINDVKSTSDNIGNNIDDADLQSLITQLAQSSESSIFITDLDSKILYSASIIPGKIMSSLPTDDLSSLILQAKANGGSFFEWLDSNGLNGNQGQGSNVNMFPQSPRPMMNNSMIYIKIVQKKNGNLVAVVLNANISPVDATVKTIRTQLLYVTFIMLVLALLMALFISKRISKPIIKMNESAKELAKGNYDIAFDGNGYKEISELGGTLNFAASELVKTENLRRDLIANISHDLRTPLTMITGYAEVMRDLPGEYTPENIQVIIDESSRLSTLVNDVLDISKLQSNTEELKSSPFNLTESIKNILNRYKKLTEQEGFTIKFLHDKDINVDADELRISQVIYNLVNNAITYTGKDKLVIVRQSMSETKVKIEVIDTGEGIPEDNLPLIWDRYYKVSKKHKRAAVGTGLGLSIVKTILEQHHAEYGVQSTIGQGSVFWFELKI